MEEGRLLGTIVKVLGEDDFLVSVDFRLDGDDLKDPM